MAGTGAKHSQPPLKSTHWAWRGFSVSLTLAALALIVLGVGAWRLGSQVVSLASVLESGLTDVRRTQVGSAVAGDAASLEDLRARVDALRSAVRPAAKDMVWTGRFASAGAWLPALQHEIVAWAGQAERLHRDLDSAADLLSISAELLDAYGLAESAMLSFKTESSSIPSTTRPRELESFFVEGLEELSDAFGGGGQRAPGFSVPRLREALAVLDRVEDRMIAAFRVGRQASGLLSDLLEIGGLARPLLAQFVGSQEQSDPMTMAALSKHLAELDERIQFASVRSDGLTKLAAESGDNDILVDKLEVLKELLGTLLIVNRATAVGVEAVQPALQAARATSSGLFGSEGILVQVLDSVEAHGPEIEDAIRLLAQAQRTLDELSSRSDGYRVRGLGDLMAVTSLLSEGLQLVNDFAPIGAEFVGAGGTRKYLLMGQSADELRATGGFVSALWLVTFEAGELTDVRYHDVVLVDDTERLMLYPPPPPGLEAHMNARVWLMRDASWEPDFPTAAQTAADMYKVGQRQEVDGVVAFNQWTFLSVVEGLGSIASPGGGADITPRNLFSKLEQETDEHGRAYTDLTLQGVIERLKRPLSMYTLMRLASAVHSSLETRDLLLFVDDPEVQSVIRRHGWDGGVRQDEADYIYVVDSNVGWSKVDRNIERQLTYTVDLRKEHRARISLVLSPNPPKDVLGDSP